MKLQRREFLIRSAGLAGAFVPPLLWAAEKPCPPPTLSVSGGGDSAAACSGTVLEQVANRLKSESAGRPAWSGAEIGVNSINTDVHYWGEPPPGSPIVAGRPPFTAPNGVQDSYNICDWAGKAHWDPVHGDWWFSGGPTGNQDQASPTIVRYRPATDDFVHWQGPASQQGGIWPPHGHAHSFDASDIDVSNRRIWRHLKTKAGEAARMYRLGWFDIDTHQSGIAEGEGYKVDAFPTISFMLDNRLLHIVYDQPGSSDNIRRFDVDSLQFVAPLAGPPGDRGVSCYHRGQIFCTTSSKNFFAILSSGRIRPLAACPIVMDIKDKEGTKATLCPIGDYVYAFCANGDIWRYDIAADTWGGAPYHRIPWLWTYDVYNPAERLYFTSKSVVGACADPGVALFCVPARLSGGDMTPARALVWKP